MTPPTRAVEDIDANVLSSSAPWDFVTFFVFVARFASNSRSLPRKSLIEVYPLRIINSSSSRAMRSKHAGPSLQWHVPTCTAEAPQRMSSNASAPVNTPPAPTTSMSFLRWSLRQDRCG